MSEYLIKPPNLRKITMTTHIMAIPAIVLMNQAKKLTPPRRPITFIICKQIRVRVIEMFYELQQSINATNIYVILAFDL